MNQGQEELINLIKRMKQEYAQTRAELNHFQEKLAEEEHKVEIMERTINKQNEIISLLKEELTRVDPDWDKAE